MSKKKMISLRNVFIALGVFSMVLVMLFMLSVSGFVRAFYHDPTFLAMDDAIRLSTYYTAFGMWLMFGVLYFVVHFKVIAPILKLTNTIQSVTASLDFGSRVGTLSNIRELDVLASDFNKMVDAIQDERNRLHELTVSDCLTGLFNRRGFEIKLNDEFARSKRYETSFCVVLIDLDNFKYINDNFGHPAGDYVLKELASRFSAVLRNIDVFARIGGDEFLILLPNTDPEQGLITANKLHATLNAAPFRSNTNNELIGYVTASIGIACYPRDAADDKSLHQAVDAVMYKAKSAGKNCVVSLNDDTQAHFNRASKVKAALNEGRITVAFQPIISMEDKSVFAYEALARIKESGGFHPAEHFIDIAVKSGLGQEIDERVLRLGLLEMQLDSTDNKSLTFFNFSTASFSDEAFMNNLPVLIRESGVPAWRIVIEITEREALPCLARVKDIMDKLRAVGIRFALDDFGSGFSSFSYLQNLKVDFLKIDGSFVRYLANNNDADRAIVENIQRLANKFSIITVAEFVEDEKSLQILKQIGVNTGQGYYLGKPVVRLDERENAIAMCRA